MSEAERIVAEAIEEIDAAKNTCERIAIATNPLDVRALGKSDGLGLAKQILCAAALRAQENGGNMGEVSDGYHTFNELYHHRAVLLSVICNDHQDIAWKSKKHSDGTMFEGMFIVGVKTPTGQATYHYDINPYWDVFRVQELEYAPEWDGHTPAQAIERIGAMAQENEPLTLEQLLEMEGKPVWYEINDPRDGIIRGCGIVGLEDEEYCEIPYKKITVYGKEFVAYDIADTLCGYDNDAIAYAHEPAPDGGKE